MDNTKTLAEISTKIDTYFANVENQTTLRAYSNCVIVGVVYTDFKPQREVINDLHNLDERIIIESVERNYSDEMYFKVFKEVYPNALDILIKDFVTGNTKSLDELVIERYLNKVIEP